VVYGAALGVAVGGNSVFSGAEIFSSFIVEAFGGGLLGLVLGWVAVRLMRLVDDAHLELILSLALAAGTFSLAAALGMSGPIAVVVAGLTLGARRSRSALSESSRSELMTFWSLVDEVLNMLLFLLIGFEVLAIAFRLSHVTAVLIAIPLSIIVRAISVLVATLPIQLRNRDRGRSLILLTWGGLRGGISVALALGLPENDVRPALLTVSYGVVVFTIIVQGLTIERVARLFYHVEEP